MRTTVMLGLFLIALAIGVLAYFFWPTHASGPITCSTNEQCGGVIETARFCREGVLYASGQQNTCTHAGKPSSQCVTTYEPWKVADSCPATN